MKDRTKNLIAIAGALVLIAAYSVYTHWTAYKADALRQVLLTEITDDLTYSKNQREIEAYQQSIQHINSHTSFNKGALLYQLMKGLVELACDPNLTDEQREQVYDLVRQIDESFNEMEMAGISPSDLN